MDINHNDVGVMLILCNGWPMLSAYYNVLVQGFACGDGGTPDHDFFWIGLHLMIMEVSNNTSMT
jgi:hypothetical protein